MTKAALVVFLSLASACSSWLDIEARVTVTAQGQASIPTLPAAVMFDRADPDHPGSPEAAPDGSHAPLFIGLICEATVSDIAFNTRLYSAPSNSDPTPIVAWIVAKPAGVVGDCNTQVPVDQQVYVDNVSFASTDPVAAIVANPDGSGKSEERTVNVALTIGDGS